MKYSAAATLLVLLALPHPGRGEEPASLTEVMKAMKAYDGGLVRVRGLIHLTSTKDDTFTRFFLREADELIVVHCNGRKYDLKEGDEVEVVGRFFVTEFKSRGTGLPRMGYQLRVSQGIEGQWVRKAGRFATSFSCGAPR
jgi:hypothetical protein